jgi:hypothetical protein
MSTLTLSSVYASKQNTIPTVMFYRLKLATTLATSGGAFSKLSNPSIKVVAGI